MKQLFLADLDGDSEKAILQHLIDEWQAPKVLLENFKVLIAYESVGSYGCDSAGWYLLRHKKTKELYEVHGSHCSCYGFEGQFDPEVTELAYLKSDKFHFLKGGYDNDDQKHDAAVKHFIHNMRQSTNQTKRR